MSLAAGLSPTQKGLAAMILSGLLLTGQDAVVKWLTGGYATGEIMFWRGLLSFLPMSLLIWHLGGIGLLRTGRPGALVMRSVLAALTSLMIVVSFRYLPLADALAIVFFSPILLTALAVPLLGERVGARRWSAVAIGFVGMLLIVRPTGAGVGIAVLAPLSAAFLSTFRDIATRRLGATDPALTILFYSTVLSTLIGLFDMPRGLTPPTLADLGLFLVIGIMWASAHLFAIIALSLAEASALSPLKYLSLVWGTILGFLIWGHVPDAWVVAGAALVVASGLYILHRERLRAN
ncbi:MAG: DMT family transporter [Alphaproteobacteria bacterium]|jgi:drug/metabolite transporter (DMT)-like permease|nr:DMT family transporter [Alphaproteobacteria bacterium]